MSVVGTATDVYGLGAMLYAILTGRSPHQSESGREAFESAIEGDFPKPSELRKEIPKPLESICLKAMAARPEDRYESPRHLASDLRHWIADEPVSSYQSGLITRVRRKIRNWL